MTTEEALVQLAESTADALLGVLTTLAPGAAERDAVAVVPAGVSPLHSIPEPAVVASVSYVDGVTGGNVFAITRLGARRLAASMMMTEPPTEDEERELDELELSAVGEAMNQMMAAAAGATSRVLGEEVEISAPEVRFVTRAAEAEGLYAETPHATAAAISVLGEPCRLIQLVPNAFVVRITRALSDLAAEEVVSPAAGATDPVLSPDSIRDIPVRMWAELGRVRMQLGRAVGLGAGAVVELDRAADDPLDLYVNGRRFATGRLMLVDKTEWAIRVEQVLDSAAPYRDSPEGGT